MRPPTFTRFKLACLSPGDATLMRDLLRKIKKLETHVFQLRNVISKQQPEGKTYKNKRNQRPFDFGKYHTRHVALKVMYLGWDYHGLAVQEDTNKTIEAAMFEALIKTKLIESRETADYHRSGRTDKGVSAFSQVISLDLRTALSEGVGVKLKEGMTSDLQSGVVTEEIEYCKILNKVLPPEIRVLAWCPVDPDFSARFSCLKRTYKYYFPISNLDMEAMREAANKMVGFHDFRNICKMDVGNGVINYERTICETNISTLDGDGECQMCELTVVGISFLWHQIRCIVAVLFLVGMGKETTDIVSHLLDVKTHPKKPQYPIASELPLVLFDCEFENVNWIYSKEWHDDTVRHLQNLWTQYNVKATIIKQMLKELVPISPTSSTVTATNDEKEQNSQLDCLIPGSKPRVYTPLLKRPTCESLEAKIENFSKRRKRDGI